MKIITKNVVFEPDDFRIVAGTARLRGLGGKGFSSALRQIIREWFDAQGAVRFSITEKGREVLAGAEGEDDHG